MDSADLLFDDIALPADIAKFEKVYNDQRKTGTITKTCQFEYAYCLVRSSYPADIKKGILLMEELYQKYTEDRRDFLYYLAIGNARIKEFSKALNYCRNFLKIEPNNQQVLALEGNIQNKLNKAGRDGVLVVAGSLLAVGAAAGAAFIVSKIIK